MDIRITKLHDEVNIPKRQTKGSAGADIYAWLLDEPYKQITIKPCETVKISTKIALEIPMGYFGGIYARSGLATKFGLVPGNCVGIIDEDFRGEVMVALHNHSNKEQTISHGERIAQLIVMPYVPFELVETDELTNTARGTGGFGSTGI